MTSPLPVDAGVRRQRSSILLVIAAAFPAFAALWLGVFYLVPPPSGMEEPLARLMVALQCCCFAVLFCFVTGIEAVAHERLHSPGIDPLAPYESLRMTVNLRYLQHTLEQLVVFVPGVFGLAFYASNGRSMRVVLAVTAVWIASRGAFWIGYHHGSLYRAAGAPGMMQSMLVLLYVCSRFGYDIDGIAGAIAPIAIFAAIDVYLFLATRRAPA
ncbi:MAG: hypothetical protein JO267_08530 [Alphaproteobacteria bacterium]|nr:hypothetical protein [Alphaproteobacteria bacterium]